jgi:cell shape-determining protein MreC
VIDRLSVQIENLKMSLQKLNDSEKQGSKLKEENEFLKECLTDAFKHSQLLQEIAQQHKLKQVA